MLLPNFSKRVSYFGVNNSSPSIFRSRILNRTIGLNWYLKMRIIEEIDLCVKTNNKKLMLTVNEGRYDHFSIHTVTP
jgi:hypothetical protein